MGGRKKRLVKVMANQKVKLKPTIKAIQNIKPTDSEVWHPFGGGCYLVVAKKGKNKNASKRFVGKTTIGNPSNKSYAVPLGVWEKDIKHPEEVIAKWNEMKVWGKENNRDLTNSEKNMKHIVASYCYLYHKAQELGFLDEDSDLFFTEKIH